MEKEKVTISFKLEIELLKNNGKTKKANKPELLNDFRAEIESNIKEYLLPEYEIEKSEMGEIEEKSCFCGGTNKKAFVAELLLVYSAMVPWRTAVINSFGFNSSYDGSYLGKTGAPYVGNNSWVGDANVAYGGKMSITNGKIELQLSGGYPFIYVYPDAFGDEMIPIKNFMTTVNDKLVEVVNASLSGIVKDAKKEKLTFEDYDRVRLVYREGTEPAPQDYELGERLKLK